MINEMTSEMTSEMTIEMATDEARPTFEEWLELLEKTVGEMETGDLSLADTLDKYESGVEIAKKLKGMLDYSEKQLTILKARQESGASPTEDA